MDGDAGKEKKWDCQAGNPHTNIKVGVGKNNLEKALYRGQCRALRAIGNWFFCRPIFQEAMMIIFLVLPLMLSQIR